MNVENIQNDFSIYQTEYIRRVFEKYEVNKNKLQPKHTPGRPKWEKVNTFDNLYGRFRGAIKAEYKYAIDRQQEHARHNGISVSTIIGLIQKLSEQKLIPLSLQPRLEIVKQAKSRRNSLGKLTIDDVKTFQSIQLYKYRFRGQLTSYLIQKRQDMTLSADDLMMYDRVIQTFTDMDTDTKNCITFNQAVDNLYEKVKNMAWEEPNERGTSINRGRITKVRKGSR